MALSRKLLPLIGATFVAAIGSTVQMPAQDPVPTHVRTNLVGEASGTPRPVVLSIGVAMNPADGAQLRVDNARPDAAAALVFGFQPAIISLPYDATLLVEPLIAISGVVDAQGSFSLPLDFADKAMIGPTLLVQGLQLMTSPLVFQTTPALAITYRTGNPQPRLSYTGPPLTATALVRTEPTTGTRHELLASVVVPTSAWDFRIQSVTTSECVSCVYLVLEAPGPDEIVMPVLQTLRVGLELGAKPADRVQLMIERRVRDLPGVPVFLLAAEVWPQM